MELPIVVLIKIKQHKINLIIIKKNVETNKREGDREIVIN